MAKAEPAKRHRSDGRWNVPVPASRPRLTAIAGEKSGEGAASHPLAQVKVVGWWLVILAAGLAVWTGAFYAFLSQLTGSFS